MPRGSVVGGVLVTFIVGAAIYHHSHQALYRSSGSLDGLLPGSRDYLEPDNEMCENKFGLEYLHNYARNAALYTTSRSATPLVCLRSPTSGDDPLHPIDSFCIAGPAEVGRAQDGTPQFRMNCALTDQPTHGNDTLPRLENFPESMPGTGIPSLLKDGHITFDAPSVRISKSDAAIEPVAVLIRRQNPDNYWHSIQDIISAFNSLDILLMTPDPTSSIPDTPLLTARELNSAQIIILDELSPGPAIDLWDVLARGQVLRPFTIAPGTRFSKVIMPLPSSASPFWSTTSEHLPCTDSHILSTFRHRVFHHLYGATAPTRDLKKPLIVTYIDRTTTRKLVNKQSGLQALAQKYPGVQIQRVDFTGMAFSQQVQVVADTDILVGVHGAGMTHALFLPPGSAVVEIVPENLQAMTYRNLARLAGHGYFTTHAKMVAGPDDRKGQEDRWKVADVEMKDEEFVEVVESAIKSMYNRGMLNTDLL